MITDISIEPAANREVYVLTIAGYTEDEGREFSDVNVVTPAELIKFINERLPYLPKPEQPKSDNNDNVRPFPTS